jgi:hypothetical protein
MLDHLKSVNTDLTRRAPLRRSSIATASNDTTELNEAYYVFCDDLDGGYVIVSASDKMRPIVAYSPTGYIDETVELPAQLSNWLNLLSDATRYVELHPEAAITTAQTAGLSDLTPIAPLLGNIAWDQNDPYSLLCPRKYPTGCMATALAQVMRYHRYPEHGMGSNSYTNAATSQTLTVDFSEQTYQWDLMKETYDETATEEERQEVAKLMYHCGVALNMAYAADNSGSTAPYYLAATVDHFGYNDLTTLQYRNMYTYDEWNRLLYAQLAAGRPILFSGQSSSGGHAFVVDGYRSNGYYHVNWGWSGQYDGYYDISILNPTGVGAGAAVSDNGYSLEQSAVLQLTPEAHVGRYFSPVAGEGTLTSTTKSTTVGGKMRVRMTDLTNYSPKAISGEVYALIEGVDTTWMCPISSLNIAASGINMNTSNISTDITLPSDLTDGVYTLRPYFRPEGGDSTAVVRFRISSAGYLTLTVANGKVTVAKPALDLKLSASDWSFDEEEVVAGTTNRIAVTVANRSEETYVGRLALELEDPTSSTTTITSDSILHLAAGDSVRVSFAATLNTVGEWVASLAAVLQNVTNNPRVTFSKNQPFTVVSVASAITEVAADRMAPVAVYDLTGRRKALLAPGTSLRSIGLPAGLYIVDGRRVWVK